MNSSSSSNVIGGLVGAMALIGGKTGDADNVGLISDSYAYTSITSKGNGNYIGGLLGGANYITSDLSPRALNLVKKSYAIGSISSTDTNSTIGGLIGINIGDTVQSSYSSVKLTFDKTSTVGGLIGENRQNTVYASDFWDTSLNLGLNAVGKGNQGGATGLSTTQIRTLMTWPLNSILSGVQSPDLYASFNPLNLAPLK